SVVSGLISGWRWAAAPPGVTITPPFPERANAATLRSISSVSRTFNGVSSTPRDCATDLIAPNCPMPAAVAGSRNTNARVRLGAISLSNSAHFPLMLYSKFKKPVISAWVGHALYEAGTNRIWDIHEYNRDGASGLLQRRNCHTAHTYNYVRRERNQFRSVAAKMIAIAPNVPSFNLEIAANRPAQLLKCLCKELAS